jgi:hypothetical protein
MQATWILILGARGAREPRAARGPPTRLQSAPSMDWGAVIVKRLAVVTTISESGAWRLCAYGLVPHVRETSGESGRKIKFAMSLSLKLLFPPIYLLPALIHQHDNASGNDRKRNFSPQATLSAAPPKQRGGSHAQLKQLGCHNFWGVD